MSEKTSIFTPRDLELLAAAMQSTKDGEISVRITKQIQMHVYH